MPRDRPFVITSGRGQAAHHDRPTQLDLPLRTVSLRRRVAVWVLLLLVVVLTVMGLVVNWLLGQSLRSDLKNRLEDKASYAAVLQERGVSGQALADQMTGNGVLGLFDSGGNQYVGQEPGPPPAGLGRPARPRPGRPVPAVAPMVTVVQNNGLMVATVRLPTGTLTLSAGESEIDGTLARLRQVELVVGGGTLLVAGLLLITVVRAALRPLEKMTGLARRIRDGMLDALEAAETQARAAETQARYAEDRMRQFLADASHDLRTPLAGVIAGAEQLLRIPTGRAEREELLVQVVRQARRAARLVDDLLLMTRLDTAAQQHPGRPVAADAPAAPAWPIDPVQLVRRELTLLELRRPDLAVDIVDGPDVLVRADPDQLQRAFGNLIDNAAAAAPLGGLIRIGRSLSGGWLAVRVMDTGPGVPAEHRERIFDRFVRVSTSRSTEGSGLGLPISRAIARAAGGDLRCLPSSHGACFELTLPAVATDVRCGPTPAPELLPAR